MAFRDAANAAAVALLRRLGDGTATYQHASGAAVALDAMLDEGVEVPDASGQYIERARALSVRKADLLEQAVAGDQVTVLGERYRVQRVLADDGIVVRLAVA